MTAGTMQKEAIDHAIGAARSAGRPWPLWIQCGATGLVALGAAYASYQHGRAFALRFGADATTASIWPLIVDGLLTLATIELWRGEESGKSPNGRRLAWTAFLFGISLSLCANVGSAPILSVFGVTVAACPPLALLLAVELLNRALKRHQISHHREVVHIPASDLSSSSGDGGRVDDDDMPETPEVPTAEERMWRYYSEQIGVGREPSGAELDRIAGTHNYGRRVLRRWKDSGRASLAAPSPLLPVDSNAFVVEPAG
ncbi:DUF2637 domain-containing protein [Amycolatopsis sp. NPDC051372]|uniref:DUF2637 domain-containing protein n=1 Tax=unclassified Amycolatopsis TaxID=2618356 RepID=UPI0034231872